MALWRNERSDGDQAGPAAEPVAEPVPPTPRLQPRADASAPADDTETVHTPAPNDRPGWHVRLFGSQEFFRLWLAQLVQALGDWVGFFAITYLASQVAGGSGSAAIGFVMTARILPGLFLAPLAGVLVDRWDRKRVMVLCNLARALVVTLLPFVSNVPMLVVAAFFLELFTLMWGPAKEATVPNLVPHDHLTTANSLGLAAAYGTFPFGSLVFALMATVSSVVAGIDALDFFPSDQVAVAFYFQAAAFCVSAYLISTLKIPHRARHGSGGRIDWSRTFRELKEGWHYMFINRTVRAVNLGLATGLVGGGMLIPLGAAFATEVLGGDATDYGLFVTALGFGVAVGVVVVSALQRKVPKTTVFTYALFVAGGALFIATSSSSLTISAMFVFFMGVSVGPVYVIGFAILQEEVTDDLRGRVFSTLNTLVRLCVLLSMVIGPFLAALLSGLDIPPLEIGSYEMVFPGVRLTLWIASFVIVGAGFISLHSIRSGQRLHAATVADHPSRGGDGNDD